jgi:tetratricopeptide (TPR) repeat protein
MNSFFKNQPASIFRLLALAVFAMFSLLLLPQTSSVCAQTQNNIDEDHLFEMLANAPNEQEGRKIEFQIWQYWTDSAPSEDIKAKLIRGMEKRRESDLAWAEDLLDDVVTAAPDYAEGWNQRGFVKFLVNDLEGSLNDLEEAVKLEPRHFGALSGMYHVLRLLNRPKAAVRALHMAVKIHPWLKERNDLPEELRPKSIPIQEL